MAISKDVMDREYDKFSPGPNDETVINIISSDSYLFEEYDDTTTADVIYIGNRKQNDFWVIIKFDSVNKTMRYCRGESDYASNWADRENLSYGY